MRLEKADAAYAHYCRARSTTLLKIPYLWSSFNTEKFKLQTVFKFVFKKKKRGHQESRVSSQVT